MRLTGGEVWVVSAPSGLTGTDFPPICGLHARLWRLRSLRPMKVLNSLKSAKTRDKNCRVVRRKGRVYVINKKNPRFKARQG